MTDDRGEPDVTPPPGSTPAAPQGGGGARPYDTGWEDWCSDLTVDGWLEGR
jgi:hypothetical protein